MLLTLRAQQLFLQRPYTLQLTYCLVKLNQLPLRLLREVAAVNQLQLRAVNSEISLLLS